MDEGKKAALRAQLLKNRETYAALSDDLIQVEQGLVNTDGHAERLGSLVELREAGLAAIERQLASLDAA